MNFISITFDDLNAFAFLKTLYGGTLHTPNLDRVMAMGTTFENTFAQIAVCNASRTSVLSGRDPSDTGVHFNFEKWYDHVAPSETLPGVLHAGGLKTGIFGKVFHDNAPRALESQFADVVFRSQSFDKGATHNSQPYSRPTETHGDYVSTTEAIKFLDGVGSEPFALFLGLFKPHLAWDAPQEYYDLYPLESITLPYALDGDLSDVPAFMRDLITDDHGQILSTIGWQKAVQGYLASVSFADAQLGRILEALETSGHAADTAIAVWTDHGFHLGDKDNWHKFTLWDEAGRSPMIVALPGAADDGQRVSQVVELVDFMPTVLDVLGMPAPEGLSGKSLLPLIADPGAVTDGYAVTTMYGSASIRTNEYRFTLYEDGSTELYDIVADPNQWKNLAGNPVLAQVQDGLAALLQEDLASQGWVWADPQGLLVGGEGNELFVVAAGDKAAGGAGDDIYFLADAASLVSEKTGEGVDRVFVDFDYELPNHIEKLELRNSSLSVHIVGNDLANHIVAKGIVEGRGGDDQIRVFSGSTVYGGDGNDTLQGQTAKDNLLGEAGDDVISGGSGSDTLEGGAGRDLIDGQTGFDTVAYRTAAGGVTIDLSNVRYQDTGSAGLDRLAMIENVSGSDYSDAIRGDSTNNEIKGFDGDDVLDGGDLDDLLVGGKGADRLIGGNGMDEASYSGLPASGNIAITVNLATGTGSGGYAEGDILSGIENVTGTFAADTLIGNSKANILRGSGGRDLLRGGAGDDTLDGGEQNDELDGGSGNDRLVGGSGEDTVSYRGATAAVAVSLVKQTAQDTRGAGTDILIGIENATGSAFSDLITGSAAANLIDGRGGADRMIGGDGNDTYVVDSADDRAVETSASGGIDTVRSTSNFKLGNHVEHLILEGNAVTGLGNGLANTITGNARGNRLDGGVGGDRMSGGAGNDIYYADHAGDRTVETLASDGNDTVRSSVSFALGKHVEYLILSGSATTGMGNELANAIIGNGTANRLDGGGGADIMRGNGGNDFYLVDHAGDRVFENSASGGIDTVRSSVNFVLRANAENLILDGNAQVGLGNGLANSITGNSAANRLDGRAGADRLTGGGGNDIYYVDNGSDQVLESIRGGYDTVRASVSFRLDNNVEQLILAGSAADGAGNNIDNRIVGNASANMLNGLAGSDILIGGDGADRFLLRSAIGIDIDDIMDFSVADDTVVLDRTIFSKIAATGLLRASAFHVGKDAADAADRIVYDAATGNLWYDADGSGAGAAILFARLDANLALTNVDFTVVA